MRFFLTAMLVFGVSLVAYAQDGVEPWGNSAQSGAVEFSTDFCDVCECCSRPVDWLSGLPKGKSSSRVKIFDYDVYESLEALSDKLEGNDKERILSPLVGAGSFQGVVDFCEVCGCCAQTPNSLKISPPVGWELDSEGYRRFKFVGE